MSTITRQMRGKQPLLAAGGICSEQSFTFKDFHYVFGYYFQNNNAILLWITHPTR